MWVWECVQVCVIHVHVVCVCVCCVETSTTTPLVGIRLQSFRWQHPTAWGLGGNKGGREGGSRLNTSVPSFSLPPYPAEVSKWGHASIGTASNYPHLHAVPTMLDCTSSNHEPNKPFLSSCFIWSQKWTKSWISNNEYIWVFNGILCTIYFILYFFILFFDTELQVAQAGSEFFM